jgi:formylglycine-generating enzyme required for sulfatase activity
MTSVTIATEPPALIPSPTVKEFPRTITATSSQPFINSISMKFVPLDEQPGRPLLLICTTPTLLQHYSEYCDEVKGGDQTWRRSVGGSLGSVTYVNWHDANDFCDWLTRRERQLGIIDKKGTYRLPSGAEWNRALNVSSTLGLVEMTGGVWQWCQDSVGNHERVLRGGNRTNGDIHGNEPANLRLVSYGFRVVLQIAND